MEKLTVGLLERDEGYSEMLSRFVRQSAFDGKIIFKIFTAKESACRYAQEIGKLHILLADPLLLGGPGSDPSADCLVCLTQNVMETQELKHPFLFKFQPLHELFSKLLAFYTEQGFTIRPAGLPNRKTAVVTVYSAVGGTGKTTAAVNLARQLAARNYRTFYLNLESLASAPVFPAGERSQAFSKLLYYAKANPTHLTSKLHTLISRDPGSRVDYFEPLDQLGELIHIDGEDTRTILNALIGTADYDYIVVDLESSYHERILSALPLSDKLIWLLTDDVHCLHKTNRMLASLNKEAGEPLLRKDKLVFLLNKFTGAIVNDFLGAGIEISGRLPYIPHWKSVLSAETLLQEPVFQDELMQFFLKSCAQPEVSAVG